MISNKHFNKYETTTKLNINHLINEYEKAKKKGIKKFEVMGEDENTYLLKTKSVRYNLFARDKDKLECVKCGTKATAFYLQRDHVNQDGPYHANLWGINSNNELIMLTKDHILRKRDGGKDNIDNLQIMCFYCNSIVKN